MKYLIMVLFLLTSIYTQGYEKKGINDKKKLELHTSKFCDATVSFIKKGVDKKQLIKLSEKVQLHIEQSLSTFKFYGAKVATNAMCQKINGTPYTGTDEEWAGYLSNALDGIKKVGAKDINLSLSAGEDLLFPEQENVKEFIINATFDKNKQMFVNYVLLNKKSNTVYSISVSGPQKLHKYLRQETTRLVKSLTFNTKE